MLDLLATGYPSLDHIIAVSRLAGPGETALAGAVIDDALATPGGCGANVAVGLRRLGLMTGVALLLGDDDGGAAYLSALEAIGVDTRNVARLRGERTSRSYLFRSPEGEYQNFFFPGAADVWRGELVLAGLPDVRLALVTVGYLPYNRQFVARCAEAGVPLAWQLKPDIAAYPPQAVGAFLAASRVVFCNRREAQYLLDVLSAPDMRALFDHGVELMVTTLGAEGARVDTPKGAIRIPAVPVHAVDTTGAGDAFTAGFLAGYLRGLDPETCGRMGAVAAAFAVEAVGCQTNLPDWDRLMARLMEVFGRP